LADSKSCESNNARGDDAQNFHTLNFTNLGRYPSGW
jgi:hypothetical protein